MRHESLIYAGQLTKTDATQHPQAFNHVGLLANEPPGQAELLFI